jgi:hypothetical protein
MSQRDRFLNWRRRAPPRMRYLVDSVLGRIVPALEREGFVWYADFAGNDPQEIGGNEIPLQRRGTADVWPTVQIYFYRGIRSPLFRIAFSGLPRICRSPVKSGIPRERAVAHYGPAYFFLHRKNYNSEFGFNWMLLLIPSPRNIVRLIRYLYNWRQFIDSEVQSAADLLPELIELFDRGIPEEWLLRPRGPVTDHVTLVHSWSIWGRLH